MLRQTYKASAYTLGTSGRKHPWLLDMYERKGYTKYIEREAENGDLGILMYKVLIPERFDAAILGAPPAEEKVETTST